MMLITLGVVALAATTCTVTAAAPPDVGPYSVNHTTVHVDGLVSGGSTEALLYFPATPPTSGDRFPFVSFAHGMLSGGPTTIDWYGKLLTDIASHGYIVIAVQSCPVLYCNDFYKDVLTAIAYANQQGPRLHPVLSFADFDHVGVVGHSMGGHASVACAGHADAYNISVAVALHPSLEFCDGCASRVQVPVFFASGSADIVVPAVIVSRGFHDDPVRPKLYAELKGAGHMEPTKSSDRWDPYVSAMLNCYLRQDASSCALMWGDGEGSLCSTYDFVKCERDTANSTVGVPIH